MSGRIRTVLACITLISLLSSAGYACAVGPSSGPDEATGPSDSWVLLPVGETHWYAFDYSGHYEVVEEDEEDEDVDDVDDDDVDDDEDEDDDGDEDAEEDQYIWVSSPVDVRLTAEPGDSVSFSIWTEEQVRLWSLGKQFEPVGRGTKNELESATLFWSGGLGRPGRYYIVAEQEGSAPGYYLLRVDGEDITLPGVSGAGSASAGGAGTVGVVIGPGSGPDSPLAPTEGWRSIGNGQLDWYAFDYQDSLPAEVLLDAEPDGSVTFSVWTEEQVRLWALGQDFEPVGRGTQNDMQPGDLFWSGRLGRPGRFYVVVQHEGSVPGTGRYQLRILGAQVLGQ
jgi:hypothetical protein